MLSFALNVKVYFKQKNPFWKISHDPLNSLFLTPDSLFKHKWNEQYLLVIVSGWKESTKQAEG